MSSCSLSPCSAASWDTSKKYRDVTQSSSQHFTDLATNTDIHTPLFNAGSILAALAAGGAAVDSSGRTEPGKSHSKHTGLIGQSLVAKSQSNFTVNTLISVKQVEVTFQVTFFQIQNWASICGGKKFQKWLLANRQVEFLRHHEFTTAAESECLICELSHVG